MDSHVDAGARLLGERLSGGMPQRLDDVLRLFVRAAIDNHRDNPRLHRVLFEEAPRAPAFLSRLHDLEQLTVERPPGYSSSTRRYAPADSTPKSSWRPSNHSFTGSSRRRLRLTSNGSKMKSSFCSLDIYATATTRTAS
jgi:hypothetical protein